MKNINCKKILSLFLIINIICTTTSCKQPQELIDYNLEIVEETKEVKKDFNFERETKAQKYTVQTQKEKDIMINSEIKNLIAKRSKTPVKVKGVYIPAYVAGKSEKFDPILENIAKTDFNAIVVDIKDELGRITIENNIELAKELRTTEVQIKDIQSFIEKCHNNNIYVIARIASFLDNFSSRQDKTMGIRKRDGKLYKDNLGYYWLNPYVDKVREYIKQIAIFAAEIGFDEVQLDYFRFSTDSGMRRVDFDEEMTQGKTKIDILTTLAQDIYKELIQRNTFFSIDVYGSIINSYKDQYNIGQDYPNLIKYCDYICPMVYPSHYANKSFGIDVPDTKPYDTVFNALKASKQAVNEDEDRTSHFGEVRPWLQAFTANYLAEFIVYDKAEYEAQIKAVYDAGYEEYLFWQGGGVYKWPAFIKESGNTSSNIVDTKESDSNE